MDTLLTHEETLQGFLPVQRITHIAKHLGHILATRNPIAFTRLDPGKALAFPGLIVRMNALLQTQWRPLIPLVYLMTPWHFPENLRAVENINTFARENWLVDFSVTVQRPVIEFSDIQEGMKRMQANTISDVEDLFATFAGKPLNHSHAEEFETAVARLHLLPAEEKILYAYLMKQVPGKHIRDHTGSTAEFNGMLRDRAVTSHTAGNILKLTNNHLSISLLSWLTKWANYTLAHELGIGDHPLFGEVPAMQDFPSQRGENGLHAACGFNASDVRGDGEGI